MTSLSDYIKRRASRKQTTEKQKQIGRKNLEKGRVLRSSEPQQ